MNGFRVIKLTIQTLSTMMASLPKLGLPKEPKEPFVLSSFSDICDMFGLTCILRVYITSIPLTKCLERHDS